MRQQGLRAGLGAAGLASCLAALTMHVPAAAQPRPAAAPEMFGTVAIPIDAKRFSKEWTRASEDATSHPALRSLVAGAPRGPRLAQLQFVQSEVHRRIRWRSDATEWGAHDYWASAAQTLERGVGDMEDRAIVKMQALRLLGFSDDELFLTLGRDKVGGPMAVLVARADGRFYVLDDLGGRPVPADRRDGFTPQLSFGGKGVFAHAGQSDPRMAATGAGAPR